MKKIMFNDRFYLTQAVLDGRKRMTRRIVPEEEGKRLDSFFDGDDWDYAVQTCIDDCAAYYIGDVVAVAQSYHDLNKNGYLAPEGSDHVCEDSAGYENKMFVRADLMPHQIRITDVRIERLQDISEEDCLKEGIAEFAPCCECSGNCYSFAGSEELFYTAKDAFAALIDKISGKGTWASNPFVFVYDFKLKQ